MDKLNIEQAHILGASFGGMIAQEVAISFGERVRTLTLLCTFPACDSFEAEVIDSWKIARRKLTVAEFFRMIGPWVFTHRFYENPANLERFVQGFAENPHPQSVDAFLRQCDAIKAHNTLDRLALITAPTHVIVGGEDILTPLRHARTLTAEIPGAKLTVIPEAGHMISAAKPAELRQAVLAFLAEH
jgi:3-oxoadipate enol-lactonase